MKKSRAPTHLSKEAQKWFRKLCDEYAIDDEAGLLILQTSLEAFDRMRRAQVEISERGEVFSDRFGQIKANPAVAMERDARSQMLAALKQLNLDLEPLRDGPGRPPGR